MTFLQVDPFVVQQAQKFVDEAKLAYSDAKTSYLTLLEEKSELKFKFQKDKNEIHLATFVNDLYVLEFDPEKRCDSECRCQENREQLCSTFNVSMKTLQSKIDEAFQTQHEAAMLLLDFERRLSDAKNGYPLDHCDHNYESQC